MHSQDRERPAAAACNKFVTWHLQTHLPNQPIFECLTVLYNTIPITAQAQGHFALGEPFPSLTCFYHDRGGSHSATFMSFVLFYCVGVCKPSEIGVCDILIKLSNGIKNEIV